MGPDVNFNKSRVFVLRENETSLTFDLKVNFSDVIAFKKDVLVTWVWLGPQ